MSETSLNETNAAPTVRYSRTGWALRFIAGTHLLAAVLIFFRPEVTIEIFNFMQRLVGHFDPIANPSDKFWLTIAAGELLLYGVLCTVISFQKRNNGILLALALTKAAMVTAFWYQYRMSAPLFVYPASMAFDAIMALWLLILTFIH